MIKKSIYVNINLLAWLCSLSIHLNLRRILNKSIKLYAERIYDQNAINDCVRLWTYLATNMHTSMSFMGTSLLFSFTKLQSPSESRDLNKNQRLSV